MSGNNIIEMFNSLKDNINEPKKDVENRINVIENILLELSKKTDILNDNDNNNVQDNEVIIKKSISQLEDMALFERFDATNFEVNFNDINEQISVLNGKMNLMSDAIKVLNTKLTLTVNLENLNKENMYLKTRLYDLEIIVSKLISKKLDFKQDMKPLSAEIQHLKTQMDNLTSSIKNPKNNTQFNLKGLDSRVDSIEHDISELISDITFVKNTHKDTLGGFEQIINSKVSMDEHHKVSNNLNKHDAKFKQFKDILDMIVIMIEESHKDLDLIKKNIKNKTQKSDISVKTLKTSKSKGKV
ncbi:MAG: hypothetical protein K0B02_03570 [DPANN group archaeon]|nr:hypothetical protein [DPANN group archaeon]